MHDDGQSNQASPQHIDVGLGVYQYFNGIQAIIRGGKGNRCRIFRRRAVGISTASKQARQLFWQVIRVRFDEFDKGYRMVFGITT